MRADLFATCLVFGASAHAQLIDETIEAPSLDRWMYPFNGAPGARLQAPTFGAVGVPGFDNMDGQFLIGFDTSGIIEAGLGASSYRIGAIVVRASHSDGVEFAYDATYDSYATYLDEADPDHVPDADAGRPMLLYATGYRGGFDLLTFEEDSEFGFDPDDPENFSGIRNAYAALFDEAGDAIDVSNHVSKGVDAVPLGVGVTDAVDPGEIVPSDTEFEFTVDLCTPGLRDYVKASLDAGQLNFTITSLHSATQKGGAYPRWYTKENPIARPRPRI